MAGISTFTRETAGTFSVTASPRSSSGRCCAPTSTLRTLSRPAGKRRAGRCSAGKKAEPVGGGGRLAAAGHTELAEDVGHVHAGGLRGDEQLAGDLPVAVPGRDEPEYLVLPGREAQSGIGPRGAAAPGHRRLVPGPVPARERDPGPPGDQGDALPQRPGA